MSTQAKYIVVGSGCTGAQAAQTLVEAGVDVLMLDAGNFDDTYKGLIPDKNFVDIRANDESQTDYLLGREFESISWGDIGGGAQLTPPRKFMVKDVNRFLDVFSKSFFPVESLAYGGLGNGWGLGCTVFSDAELEQTGLNVSQMKSAYQVIADRIGISGGNDDITPYTTAHLDGIMPPAIVDKNQEALRQKYQKRKQWFNKNGFSLGRTSLALLTNDKDHRKAYETYDLDFYADKGLSTYRPWITVDELKKKPNFTYKGGVVVKNFKELESGEVEITAWNKETGSEETFNAKKLVLAPGPLGTARIVLRSLGQGIEKLPILSNPYGYFPCINFSQLGEKIEKNITGFAQLSLFHDEGMKGEDIAMASLYSYRSLMLFRIIKEAPIAFQDGIQLMNFLMPAFVIMGLHHPEKGGPNKYLALEKDSSKITGDVMKAKYLLNDTEQQRIDKRNKLFMKAMRKLGTFPIRMIDPGMGSSIHYAGVLPFNDSDKAFALSTNGKLNGTQNVYVADGSGFKYLPAKGLTLSLMANAHIAAQNALK